MSDKSKRIANLFRRENAAVLTERKLNDSERNEMLMAFETLRDETQSAAKSLCEDLNQEPDINDLLICGDGEEGFEITRKDTGAKLLIRFNKFYRQVNFTCNAPVRHREVVRVDLTNAGARFV